MPLPVIALVLSALVSVAQVSSALRPDPPMVCASCVEWNVPVEPFRIHGNTYYVGTAGLSAVLVTSDQGHVLLDGGLSQSAALIDANIRTLGFRTEDVRVITVSHEHYDHVGGIAALQRVSGATVVASAPAAQALAQGLPLDTDPQISLGREVNAFPAVKDVRVVADGEVVRVGPLAITAHLTPGHTPGAATWSWQACEGSQCLGVVYIDSLNPISGPGFRFTDDPARVAAYRRGLATVESLPCDIALSVHPAMTDIAGKQARRSAAGANPFVDPQACRAYAASVTTRLDARLAQEARQP